MKDFRNRKFGLLAVVFLAAIGIAWLQMRRAEQDFFAPPTGKAAVPQKPAAQKVTAPSPSSATEPKKAHRNSESMADAAYKAGVLANQVKREELLLALVADLTPENAAAFLEELMRSNRTPNKPGQTVWNAFWRKWGSVDGATCLKELISRGQKNRITSDGVLAMEGWAAADPQAAAAWLKSEQPDSAIWNAAWATFHLKTHGEDPLAATSELIRLADTPAKLDTLCQQLADTAQLKQGAEGLVNWFGSIPEDLRKGAVNHCLYRLISSDPQAAVNFMTTNAQAAWRDDRHVGMLINEISQQDPAGTSSWATKLYPSPAGTPVEQTPVFQATRRWAERDPAAAKAWLDANNSQPWAEAAKSGYTSSAPEEADDLVLPKLVR